MRAILAATLLCLFILPADAKWRSGTDANGQWAAQVIRSKIIVWCRNGDCVNRRTGARWKHKGTSVATVAPKVTAEPQTLKTPFGVAIRSSVSLSGVDARLMAFIRGVSSACGPVKVISAVRHSYVGRRLSCHATGHAVDYQTNNPSCALKYAAGKRVGHSIDYYGVAAIGVPVHYHASTCGREMGVRFVHRGSSYRGKRYAKRYKKRVRYAQYRKYRRR